jgi:UDP-N-acetylglucosamine--N-acetylmuramyl-(pentapeptide) pyrophosphoryl-undecaprenol N-acetylglucosamine transferase
MGTLSELAALGKPALVVPLPDSHQGANARAFARAGAAETVDQASLSPERLASLVRDLLDDEPRRRALSEAIARYLPSDAASRIAEDVLALANGRG